MQYPLLDKPDFFFLVADAKQKYTIHTIFLAKHLKFLIPSVYCKLVHMYFDNLSWTSFQNSSLR